tara:strand:- start:1537 stop:4848 length:3312 start_codon:yes stop_codon:yes gene_type:complete
MSFIRLNNILFEKSSATFRKEQTYVSQSSGITGNLTVASRPSKRIRGDTKDFMPRDDVNFSAGHSGVDMRNFFREHDTGYNLEDQGISTEASIDLLFTLLDHVNSVNDPAARAKRDLKVMNISASYGIYGADLVNRSTVDAGNVYRWPGAIFSFETSNQRVDPFVFKQMAIPSDPLYETWPSYAENLLTVETFVLNNNPGLASPVNAFFYMDYRDELNEFNVLGLHTNAPNSARNLLRQAGSKKQITNVLMPSYAGKYNNCDFTYHNYNTLNFLHTDDYPEDACLVYSSSFFPKYDSDDDSFSDFTFSFWINPRYTNDAPGGEFKTGTIMHISSSMALSLVSGSSTDKNGYVDGYRIMLQLSQSADILPSEVDVSSVNSNNGNASLTYPKDLIYLSDDNSLKRNNWHYVSVKWSPNYNNSSGSLKVDDKTKHFYIPSASFGEENGLLSKDKLFIGNFYDGVSTEINKFFNPEDAKLDSTVNHEQHGVALTEVAATATVTVTDGDAASGMTEKQHITLTSTDGTTRRYVLTNAASDGSTATGTVLSDASNTDTGAGTAGADEDGGIAVSINLSSATQNTFLVQLKAAIEHENGHNGKITVSAVPGAANGNQSITLTQVSKGQGGNTAIIENLANVAALNFAGGLDRLNPRFNKVKSHPLNAEIHELRGFSQCLTDYREAQIRDKGLQDYETDDVVFHVPVAFSRFIRGGNNYDGIGTTDNGRRLLSPFLTSSVATIDTVSSRFALNNRYFGMSTPFNPCFSLGSGGKYINLENFVKNFAAVDTVPDNSEAYFPMARNGYESPRLYNLSGSLIKANALGTVTNTAAYSYSQGSIKKRNLMILPNDNGLYSPNYFFLKKEEDSQNKFSDRYKSDFGGTDYGIISLRNIIHSGSSVIGDGAGLYAIGDPKYFDSLRRNFFISYITQDVDSNDVSMFSIPSTYYGEQIHPGTFQIKDLKVTGSNEKISLKFKDDLRGSLYRADAETKHATWASVGNIFYDEGICFVKSPHPPCFGKGGHELKFNGEHTAQILTINVPASRDMFNSSSNASFKPVSASLNESDLGNDLVYITGVNIHDENLNVIMKANLAQPVVKRSTDEFMFKIKMDF